MVVKIFLTSLIVLFVDIISIKILGDWQDKWYYNVLALIIILSILTAVITALIIIWQT